MSRHIPFQSLRQPEREVSQERLAEILARRGKMPVETVGPAGSESRKAGSGSPPDGGFDASTASAKPAGPTPLEWLKPVNHGGGSAMVFDISHRYRIDILSKRGGDASYTCWCVSRGLGQLNERLGMVDSPIEARRLCDDHNARQV